MSRALKREAEGVLQMDIECAGTGVPAQQPTNLLLTLSKKDKKRKKLAK